MKLALSDEDDYDDDGDDDGEGFVVVGDSVGGFVGQLGDAALPRFPAMNNLKTMGRFPSSNLDKNERASIWGFLLV